MSSFSGKEKHLFTDMLRARETAYLGPGNFSVTPEVVNSMLVEFKSDLTVKASRYPICCLNKMTTLYKELSKKHGRPVEVTSRRSTSTAKKQQKKKYEGENLLIDQTANDSALALAKKVRLDAIIEASGKMILDAEKLIPITIVVDDEDDDDDDVDDSDKICVDTAVQTKLHAFFVIAASTMTQIAPDVPSYGAIAALANKLHFLQIRISKFCISCQWAIFFYSSLKSLSTFIDMSTVASVGTSAPPRGLPGGDRTKKRANRDDVNSYAAGPHNATQVVLNNYHSWNRKGDRLCEKIDERRDIFREEDPATKGIPNSTFPHNFEDPETKSKRNKLMDTLTDQLSVLLYEDYCDQMGGITKHSTLLGICIGADGTIKEHTNGFECNLGLMKCLKSQMGLQDNVKKKKSDVQSKHTLYTPKQSTESIVETINTIASPISLHLSSA